MEACVQGRVRLEANQVIIIRKEIYLADLG